MELRKIDGAAILAPLTTHANDDEAEIVENVTRDHAYAKLEEMQKTVARLSLGDDSNTAQADQVARERGHLPRIGRGGLQHQGRGHDVGSEPSPVYFRLWDGHLVTQGMPEGFPAAGLHMQSYIRAMQPDMVELFLQFRGKELTRGGLERVTETYHIAKRQRQNKALLKTLETSPRLVTEDLADVDCGMSPFAGGPKVLVRCNHGFRSVTLSTESLNRYREP